MKKIIALLLASALTVVTMASCTVSIKKNSDNASSQTDTSEETSSEEKGPTPDALYTYQITIDGDTYTLPCSYADFQKNGWEMEGEDQDVGGRTKMLGVHLKKGSERIGVQPVNLSSDTVKLTECPIVQVEVTIKDVTSIELPGGLKFDESTKPEDLVTRYGEPDETYDSEESDRYTYVYKQDVYNNVEFTIYGGNGTLEPKYGSVKVENMVE